PEAVALGHLATHVDELAIAGKLPEDSANSQAFELLNWSFFSVHGCRWGSRLGDLLFLVHARALSPRRWRQPGYRRRSSMYVTCGGCCAMPANGSLGRVF